jgi:predicted nucleotidyltransferase
MATSDTLKHNSPDVQRITNLCKQHLKAYYGKKFAGLILYGSFAEGKAEPDSDIDLLLLLIEPFNYFQELQTIIDLLQPIQLTADQLISVKPASIEEFKSGSLQLYRNIQRKGIQL